jgi:hypothetical protein
MIEGEAVQSTPQRQTEGAEVQRRLFLTSAADEVVKLTLLSLLYPEDVCSKHLRNASNCLPADKM